MERRKEGRSDGAELSFSLTLRLEILVQALNLGSLRTLREGDDVVLACTSTRKVRAARSASLPSFLPNKRALLPSTACSEVETIRLTSHVGGSG